MNTNPPPKRLFGNYVILIFAALIIALVYILSCIPLPPSAPLQYLFSALLSCLLLLVAIAIVVAAYHPFARANVKIWAFILIFAYGITVYTGYYHFGENTLPSLLTFINTSLSVFFPSRGAYEDFKDIPNSEILRFHFHLFHLSTYIYGALLVLSLFAGKIMNRSRQYFYCKERYVFFGSGEQSTLLAGDILRNNPHAGCFFYLSEQQANNKELFDRLDNLGAILFYVDFNNEKVNYTRHKAKRYFFLDPDQDFNARMALRVKDSVEETNTTIHLYVRTGAHRMAGLENRVEVHLFNQSDLIARHFAEQHPMLNAPGITIDHEHVLVNGDFRLLLLGFGRTGNELLKKCICDTQFKNTTFRATIIDQNYETHYGHHPIFYDECITAYHLEFNPILNHKNLPGETIHTVGSCSFYRWMDENILTYNRIIIALGNDYTNMKVALHLAHLLQQKEIKNTKNLIFAYVRHKEMFVHYPEENTPITLFGDFAEIYTENIVVWEKTDRIAKMVNYVYARYQTPYIETIDWEAAEKLWQQTSIFNKNSSRAVAQNVGNICRIASLVGLENVNEEQMEILAENEHMRWNAFHLVNGVRLWKTNEIPEHCIKNVKLYDACGNLLRHGCLVDYARLPEVSDRINCNREKAGYPGKEDYREVDRRIIRHFPLFMRS